jgi:hypothetical protein
MGWFFDFVGTVFLGKEGWGFFKAAAEEEGEWAGEGADAKRDAESVAVEDGGGQELAEAEGDGGTE